MSKTFDFSQFSHQSKKGILVIYGNLLYKFIKVTWIFLFIVFKDFSQFTDQKLIYIYLGLGFFLLFFLIRAYLIFINFKFKIADNHFILKQGILKKTDTSISFDRIQNINFKQNIIQQLINVHEVNIETAGSNKTEISIKAMSFLKAKALKNQLTSNKIIEEIVVDKSKEKPFLKISPLELLKISLTENHIQSLLVFLALLFGLFQQLQQVFKGFLKDNIVSDYVRESSSSFQQSLFLIIVCVILLVFTAILSSFVRVFLFHFNLRVYVKDNAFEIYQGLFTKKSFILKKEKIQNITISTNPIKKILGISFITFKQAVSGKVNQKKEKLIRIVGCKEAQVKKVKELLFNFADVDQLERKQVHVYLKIRMYLRVLLLLSIINCGFYFLFHNVEIYSTNLLLIPFFYFIINLIYKKRFYKISDKVLLVGNGSIETHLTYLPFFKVQNIKMTQTFFQERNKVVDLVFQTASGKIKLPCIEKQEAVKIYNYTLFKVESSKNLWM
ncbi:PH domain-containing protein [Polaribacter sargassicola]|uniref:PH domain-containing protein n=1 Tax=Polaribacter sargassicola TaxID=2836891 RepID=UPI001F1A9632|nr:PH domain-containing protein [Polaribacter sp. DS7-9]MCG1035446.1 PH domain-containing protein [Polaribacter sp. DS7-9]